MPEDWKGELVETLWNENLIAFLATLSGHERELAKDYADGKANSEACWYVPMARQTELRDLVLDFKYSYTAAQEHMADIENVRNGGNM